MERKDWLMLTVAAAGPRSLTPVQLQKALFLVGKNLATFVGPDFYKFIPYNYGPFSVDIYRDAKLLQQGGLVRIEPEQGQLPEYFATPQGNIRAADLRYSLLPGVASYIETVTRWTQQLTFPQLVTAIYAKYPEFRKNSVFKD